MDSEHIKDILRGGESQEIEFKEGFGAKAIVALNAFANTSGGMVLIGVADNGEVKGVVMGEETVQEWVNEIRQKTDPAIIPDVESALIDGKTVIILSVKEYPIKPISLQGRYYKRVGNADHPLSAAEVSEMHLRTLQLSWDAYPYPGGKMSDLDMGKVEAFLRKVRERGRYAVANTPEETLGKLALVKNGVPTNAAMILFANEPIGYDVHAGRLKTPDMILDDRIIKGTLFDVLDQTMRYIIGHLKVAYEIDGLTTQRTEIFEYPLPALRELVLNALIHRDYTSPVDTQIKIFDNRITIFNAGKLYGGLTVEDLATDTYQSRARNRLIVEAFYLTGDIEKYGTGYQRIRAAISEYPTMTFSYRESGNGYFVEFAYAEQKISTRREKGSEKGSEKSSEKSSEKILESIRKKETITAQELAVELHLSQRAVEKHLSNLKKVGILKRVGGRKGGHWEIIK